MRPKYFFMLAGIIIRVSSGVTFYNLNLTLKENKNMHAVTEVKPVGCRSWSPDSFRFDKQGG